MNLALSLAETFETLIKGRPSEDLGNAWATYFQIPINSSDYFLAMSILLSKMDDLHDRLKNAKITEKPKGLCLGAVVKLSSFCNPSGFNNVSVGNLKNESISIDLLYMASEFLGDDGSPEVNPITLDALIAEVTEMKNALSDLDVDERFRAFLENQMDRLLMGLRGYSSFGVEGLAKIFGAAAFELARASRTKEASAQKVKKWFAKSSSIIKKTGAAIIFAGAVAGGANMALEDGSSVLETIGLIEDESKSEPSADDQDEPSARTEQEADTKTDADNAVDLEKTPD